MSFDKNTIIRDARRYSARGQIEKAIMEWQKLLKESPDDSNIYNTIGDLCLRIDAKKEAIESYRRAATIFQKDGFILKALALYKKIINTIPDQVDAMISLAELNVERGLTGNANENYLAAAEYYMKEGSVFKVLEIYEKMVDINPDNISLRLRLADMYIREGKTEEAVKKYLEAASVCIDKGDIGNAKELYSEIISYRPNDLDALKGLYRIYQKEGKYSEAKELIKKAVDLFPRDVEAREGYEFLANTYISQGDYEKAADILRNLIEIDPLNMEFRRRLVEIEGAIPETLSVTAEREEDITLIKEKPETLLIEEETDKSVDFDTGLKDKIEVKISESSIGDKSLQEIFEEFKKEVDQKLGDKDYETHYNLGIAYKEMGLIDEAINEFQIMAEDPTWYVQASSMLGLCFMEKNLYDRSIEEFKKAIGAVGEGTEEYLSLNYDLGDVYEKAGMLDEAISIYNYIYGVDSKYRDVSSRIKKIEKTIGMVEGPDEKIQQVRSDL